MPSSLNAEQIARYQQDGLLWPLPALSAGQTRTLYERYRTQASGIKGRSNQKPHLL